MAKVSLEKDKIKFLLVEGVHQKAIDSLRAAGYTNIEFHKRRAGFRTAESVDP